MINKNRFITVLVLSMFISGCAMWKPISVQKLDWKSGDFRAQLPANWNRSKTPDYFLYMTKDGPYLQNISFSKTKTNKELPISKKRILPEMRLEEVARVVIDEMSLDQSMAQFVLESNEPVDLGGVEAFRLSFKFENPDYVKYRAVKYGFIYKKKYYEIMYVATEQYNYDKYWSDFEGFVSTFMLKT